MAYRLGTLDGRAVLAAGSGVYDVERCSGATLPVDVNQLLADADALHELSRVLREQEAVGSVGNVVLGPPVPRPSQVFGIGLNYRTHVAETGMTLPDAPLVFTKFPSCLAGPTAEIPIVSATTDYEAELVVVMGRTAREVCATEAWNHVAGLMVGQDVSDRGLQNAGDRPQFGLAKSHRNFGPAGPFVVSLDQVATPDDLVVRCDVNGERRQSDRTCNLIFDVATLIEYLSSIVTLRAGDLIFTGTPSGVAMSTGDYLRPGDVVTTTIEGLGTLSNRCVDVR